MCDLIKTAQGIGGSYSPGSESESDEDAYFFFTSTHSHPKPQPERRRPGRGRSGGKTRSLLLQVLLLLPKSASVRDGRCKSIKKTLHGYGAVEP